MNNKYSKKVITAVFIFLISILSTAVPKYIISDGKLDVKDEHIIYAEQALIKVNSSWEYPVDRFLTITRKVISVTEQTGECRYKVLIQNYTFFGIPFNRTIVDCFGIVKIK